LQTTSPASIWLSLLRAIADSAAISHWGAKQTAAFLNHSGLSAGPEPASGTCRPTPAKESGAYETNSSTFVLLGHNTPKAPDRGLLFWRVEDGGKDKRPKLLPRPLLDPVAGHGVLVPIPTACPQPAKPGITMTWPFPDFGFSCATRSPGRTRHCTPSCNF
jgi:hypothetical protein